MATSLASALLVLTSFALTAPAGAPSGSVASAPQTSSRLRGRINDTSRVELVKTASEFLSKWQRAWVASEQDRHGSDRERGVDVAAESLRRRPLVHCHGLVGQLSSPYTSAALPRNYVAISSRSSAFGACPTWPIGEFDGSTDEARNIDAGITPDRRADIRAARASLIERFRVASEGVAADLFFVGQHVRFLLDQELPDSALGVAHRCASETWWCASLEGYIHHWEGRIAAAQTAFERARDAMPPSIRCNWDDLSPFLGPSDSSAFVHADCEASMLLAERWWWLADPLFVDSINERRVAHDARTVRVALLGSLPTDGRRRWTGEYGRDALEQLLMRYGWPNRSVWLGEKEDNGHDNWMRAQGSTPQPPYTTYEYSRDRIATEPVIGALLDPFSLADTAWQLNAPSPADGNREWWPQVHIRRERPLTQIPSGQVALLRRDTLVRLAFATELSRTTERQAAKTPQLTLISSPAPGTARTLVQQPSRGADRRWCSPLISRRRQRCSRWRCRIRGTRWATHARDSGWYHLPRCRPCTLATSRCRIPSFSRRPLETAWCPTSTRCCTTACWAHST